MAIYAIGDLHLSGNPPTKPMTIFDPKWENHWNKVKEYWKNTVTDQDLVILCGDISWAMRLEDAMEDLKEIMALPGEKIMLRGNHDYWWSTASKITKATEGKIGLLQNSFFIHHNAAICGTRGWNLPSAEGFTTEDSVIYSRELMRFETSLRSAKAAGFNTLIAALHYPALYTGEEDSGFASLCEKYQVKTCIFGHIHGEDAKEIFQGEKNGTSYKLVAADFLDFKLLELYS